MHVVCKKCRTKIPVAGKPTGSTSLTGVHTEGVRVTGDGIEFGPGGSISFGPGGEIGFGPPAGSDFGCPSCGTSATYKADEIKAD